MATFTRRGDRWRAEVRRATVRATKSFATKRDAEAWARQLERAADQGLSIAPAGTAGTLAELLDRYEREVYPIKRWGPSKAYELKALRADMGGEDVREINQQRVTAYAMALRTRLGGPGIATRLSYLGEVMKAANDLWNAQLPHAEVVAAVAALKRQRVITRSTARTRRPQDAELDKVVAHATASQRMEIDLAAIVAVLRVLPLRVGELCAIEWSDLRPETKTVVIRNRKHPDVTVREGNDYEVPLLTINGVDTWKLVSERPRYFDRPFPYDRGSVSSSWWIAAKQVGVEDLHLHDLRAGAISRLLEAGVPVPLVAHLSGHKNWKILAKHYTRLNPAGMHETVARFMFSAEKGSMT